MKPNVVFLTDVSDLIDWIKGSIHCRASCSVHKHWHKPLDSRDTTKPFHQITYTMEIRVAQN